MNEDLCMVMCVDVVVVGNGLIGVVCVRYVSEC